jgi:hypothetical protein
MECSLQELFVPIHPLMENDKPALATVAQGVGVSRYAVVGVHGTDTFASTQVGPRAA